MYVEQFDVYLKSVIRNEILVVAAIIYGCNNWALVRYCARIIQTLWMKCLGQCTGCTLCDHYSI